MAPKKKGRKRPSIESKEDGEFVQHENTTDLLSPSEVVKMRKKAHQSMAANESLPAKETPKEKEKSIPRKSKTIQKSNKNNKEKSDSDKKKEKHKKDKVEGRNSDQKKLSKGMKEKRRSLKKEMPTGDIENGLVLYPCGVCNNEVVDSDEAILCEAGCEFWYHRKCAGMTDIAYQLLTKEDYAEWVCDNCIATKSVPLVKMKNIVETVPS